MSPALSHRTPVAVMIVSGEYFDHTAPDPSVITIDVLDHGLAVPRFNNQTIRPITVAEHCCRVRRIVAHLGGDGVDQLRALLHDAPEALVPWGDCLRPGKTDEMREAERHVMVAICKALGLDARAMTISEFAHGDEDIVHVADLIACYFEALLWQPGAEDWAPGIRCDRGIVRACASFGGNAHVSAWERFMPAIAPRPGESWRSELEEMLDVCSGDPDA